jgi:Na+-translocating ferredoxin:NAD+ oxidoreductase RnfC subunit
MRTLAFSATGKDVFNQWAALCCSCGLCTLYACPEELYPKEACDESKAELRRLGQKWSGPVTVKPHPMQDGRRVPIKSLIRKLHLQAYDLPAPYRPQSLQPRRLVLPLKQGAGAPNQPIVQIGDRVSPGQVLGVLPANAMGSLIHAPMAGRVSGLSETQIILETAS